MACGATQVLAKPGLGVDEGMMIVGNEMARVAAVAARAPEMSAQVERCGVKPLADVRIIAIEQYGAGPFGSVHLADLGAEVIKIEDPSTGGDIGRYVPPYSAARTACSSRRSTATSAASAWTSTTPEGRAVFEDLVRVSDVVYSNLRGDVPAKIGITYDDLKHLNPAIVCCSLTGFGMTGPRAPNPATTTCCRVSPAGWTSPASRRAADQVRPLAGGLLRRSRRGGLVLAGLHAARRDGSGWTATSAFSTRRSRC